MEEIQNNRVYGHYHYGVTFERGSWITVREFRSLKSNHNNKEFVKYFKTRNEAIEYSKILQKDDREALEAAKILNKIDKEQ